MPSDFIVIENARGLRARFLPLGASLTGLWVPDRQGRLENVVLGHALATTYEAGPPWLGPVVGRYANRIAEACYTIDGVTHELEANEGRHQLHGGTAGLDAVHWDVEHVGSADEPGLRFATTSPAGAGGHPGVLEVRATVRLVDTELTIRLEAETTAPTHVSLTPHVYWNLTGDHARSVLDHQLQAHASIYTPVDDELIPTGALAPVDGTAFDFREPVSLGARREGRYDQNLVLDGGPGPAATLFDPHSGRVLTLHTTEPGLQVYSGAHLPPPFGPFAGVCLEPQRLPNSPNTPHFSKTLLRPGARWHAATRIGFTVAR